MTDDPAHDRIVDWTLRRRRAAALARRPRLRDTLVTLLLGTLSMGLGLVTLTTTLAGIAGASMAPWNEPREVLASPPRYVKGWDPEAGKTVRWRLRIVARTILVPSRYCACIATLGAALGGAGVALGRPRRRVSALCVAGVVSCLLCLLVGIAYEIVMDLLC